MSLFQPSVHRLFIPMSTGIAERKSSVKNSKIQTGNIDSIYNSIDRASIKLIISCWIILASLVPSIFKTAPL